MHEAIDIIRGKADQDYLDSITYHCNNGDNTENDMQVDEQQSMTKQIIYLDRNNTPDIWSDI